MSEFTEDFADEAAEMASESTATTNTDLRKRRSTRIVQAVPLAVSGVDALGRPFVEHTSTLIINCHGCRYQSKHYVLKNMWVSLEIPHPETGQAPRSVRGRVAWIQRPRTVKQLFQVALELEDSGNIWGIGFPPEDWVPFLDTARNSTKTLAAGHAAPLQAPETEAEPHAALIEQELPPAIGTDNLRVFPAPGSTTDASLQLARQLARLVADAKQQIQSATGEIAADAVSAERRISFEQWDQKLATSHAQILNEVEQAIERFQHEAESRAQKVHAAASEALQSELPKWLIPQLEELTRGLTKQISQQAELQRAELARHLEISQEALKEIFQQAQEAASQVKDLKEQTETHLASKSEEAVRKIEEAAQLKVQSLSAATETSAAQIQGLNERLSALVETTQEAWRSQLLAELKNAEERWHQTVEGALMEARDRTARDLSDHLGRMMKQFQEETGRRATALRESSGAAASEAEQRVNALLIAMQEHSVKLDETVRRAAEAGGSLDARAHELESAQRAALMGFQTELAKALDPHNDDVRRRSEGILEEVQAKVRLTFESTSQEVLAQFQEKIEGLVQPQVILAEQAVHRLAGGRSLLDAALTLQQDRIRKAADESFAESLAAFRESLGSVEQILQESAKNITWQSLTELEGKVGDLRHETIEELMKTSEWYEKKAQTHIQAQMEKSLEQNSSHLREQAGEISRAFAGELDHSSRNFVEHAHTQMEEVVKESFDRARALFVEAAETTTAAFTDEIQRVGRQELDGFGTELKRTSDESHVRLNTVREQLAQQVTAEQDLFLRRFQSGMGEVLENGLAEAQKKVSQGFGPLLESWKAMTEAHKNQMQGMYQKMGNSAEDVFKNRLENVSTQWMLATVAQLDHQSRDIISGIAANAEEKLREACAQVFAGAGDSLRERMREIGEKLASARIATEPSKPKKTIQ
jgi:hypothetical protein